MPTKAKQSGLVALCYPFFREVQLAWTHCRRTGPLRILGNCSTCLVNTWNCVPPVPSVPPDGLTNCIYMFYHREIQEEQRHLREQREVREVRDQEEQREVRETHLFFSLDLQRHNFKQYEPHPVEIFDVPLLDLRILKIGKNFWNQPPCRS
jgi:hypothetical protein